MSDEQPAKINYKGVFIEKRNYGKYICHCGITLYVEGEFDTLEEAKAAVDRKMADNDDEERRARQRRQDEDDENNRIMQSTLQTVTSFETSLGMGIDSTPSIDTTPSMPDFSGGGGDFGGGGSSGSW